MNFNIYIDSATGETLNVMAQANNCTRNAVIRQAIEEWIERHSQPQWPTEILNFQGLDETIDFEACREQCVDPERDPFAD